jgi:hypothetical protein
MSLKERITTTVSKKKGDNVAMPLGATIEGSIKNNQLILTIDLLPFSGSTTERQTLAELTRQAFTLEAFEGCPIELAGQQVFMNLLLQYRGKEYTAPKA